MRKLTATTALLAGLGISAGVTAVAIKTSQTSDKSKTEQETRDRRLADCLRDNGAPEAIVKNAEVWQSGEDAGDLGFAYFPATGEIKTYHIFKNDLKPVQKPTELMKVMLNTVKYCAATAGTSQQHKP